MNYLINNEELYEVEVFVRRSILSCERAAMVDTGVAVDKFRGARQIELGERFIHSLFRESS